ncbi:MAG: PIG-L family deacetylase [Candidatus Marinimicrobia bacterium]|nr:PIG-L family deacetylase [Candidatus Neomarinimicrobiota bacterium]
MTPPLTTDGSLIAAEKPCAIPDLALPRTWKILVLAPHPDDFDAIGVTLKHLARNGHAIALGVVRTGSGVEDAYRPGLTLADKADLREQEQRRSLQFFGLPPEALTVLRLTNDADDQPIDCPENGALIAAFVRAQTPEIVCLPHGNDTNNGHRVMYALLKQAARGSGHPLALLLIRDPKTIEMRTDVYMPFDQADAEWKSRLLRCHDSQHHRNLRTRNHGFDDRILTLNREIARGLSLAHEYAEAFELECDNVPRTGNGSLITAFRPQSPEGPST